MDSSSAPTQIIIPVLTSAAGAQVLETEACFGYLDRVEIVLGTSTSIDVTVAMVDTIGAETLYSGASIVASARAIPTVQRLLTGQRLRITIANGGNAKTATIYLHVGGQRKNEVSIAGDLEIGAVELKNATDDTRAKVGAGNSAGTTDNALTVADANVLARLDYLASSGLTFYRVSIAQGATPGIKDLTTGLTLTGKVARLHRIVGTLHAGGSIQFKYDDDGAGANAVALSGAITLDANAGPEEAFNADARGCLVTATAKHLTLTSVTGAFNGYAIISLASS